MPTSGRAQTGAAIGREFSYALSRRASWRHRVQVLDTYPGAPSESAPGPSGSFSSGWPATARMTLLTLDRTHLDDARRCLFGAEPMVRIHLPPAASLRTFGS